MEIRTALLIEDNPADAHLVAELLEMAEEHHRYRIIIEGRMSDAESWLQREQVDVVLVDLRLPDAEGVESVHRVRMVAPEIPIVVLTGNDDESLGLQCIHAGAQDYLCKNDLKPDQLRRVIGYAITRLREAQIRELTDTLAKYQMLSSSGSPTSVTAAMTGTGPLRERLPEVFEDLVYQYVGLVNTYLDQLVVKKEKPRYEILSMVTALGEAGAGPRDLLDVHLQALDQVVPGNTFQRVRSLTVESRLLALEMMGLLVDYYRVGHRRQSRQELAADV